MNTDQAVAHFGSKKKLADALGITAGAVTLWKNVIPLLRQYQIQAVTGGGLKVDQVYPVVASESCLVGPTKASTSNGSVCAYSHRQGLS